MLEPWRQLVVGDRVRIVRLPSGADAPGSLFHPETRELYCRLIARGRAVRIFQIDEHDLPWIRCRFRGDDGAWAHHWLAINDDSWVRVVPRG